MLFSKTLIQRHKKENLQKCSLRGLESREDMLFFTYPKDPLPSLQNCVLLTLDAPVLSVADAHLTLFLIDGTWKHSEVMYKQLQTPHLFEKRSLPPELYTAYPRKQTDCPDPRRGLASVEALFAAYVLLGRNPSGLLDFYYWKKVFLQNNAAFFSSFS